MSGQEEKKKRPDPSLSLFATISFASTSCRCFAVVVEAETTAEQQVFGHYSRFLRFRE
jgi:hypothetical protein